MIHQQKPVTEETCVVCCRNAALSLLPTAPTRSTLLQHAHAKFALPLIPASFPVHRLTQALAVASVRPQPSCPMHHHRRILCATPITPHMPPLSCPWPPLCVPIHIDAPYSPPLALPMPHTACALQHTPAVPTVSSLVFFSLHTCTKLSSNSTPPSPALMMLWGTIHTPTSTQYSSRRHAFPSSILLHVGQPLATHSVLSLPSACPLKALPASPGLHTP